MNFNLKTLKTRFSKLAIIIQMIQLLGLITLSSTQKSYAQIISAFDQSIIQLAQELFPDQRVQNPQYAVELLRSSRHTLNHVHQAARRLGVSSEFAGQFFHLARSTNVVLARQGLASGLATAHQARATQNATASMEWLGGRPNAAAMAGGTTNPVRSAVSVSAAFRPDAIAQSSRAPIQSGQSGALTMPLLERPRTVLPTHYLLPRGATRATGAELDQVANIVQEVMSLPPDQVLHHPEVLRLNHNGATAAEFVSDVRRVVGEKNWREIAERLVNRRSNSLLAQMENLGAQALREQRISQPGFNRLKSFVDQGLNHFRGLLIGKPQDFLDRLTQILEPNQSGNPTQNANSLYAELATVQSQTSTLTRAQTAAARTFTLEEALLKQSMEMAFNGNPTVLGATQTGDGFKNRKFLGRLLAKVLAIGAVVGVGLGMSDVAQAQGFKEKLNATVDIAAPIPPVLYEYVRQNYVYTPIRTGLIRAQTQAHPQSLLYAAAQEEKNLEELAQKFLDSITEIKKVTGAN